MNIDKFNFNDWDFLYAKGMQGEYPSEMLIRFVNSKLRNKSGIKILDIGCGTGRNLAFLAEKRFKPYGIECSGKAIEIAENWLMKKKVKVDIKHGSVLDKNLYEKDIGAVVDIACMQHHVLHDIKLIISNVHHSIAENGYFFSIIKNQDDSLYNSGECIEGPTYKFPSNAEKVNVPVIITFPSFDEIVELFSCFSHVEIEKEEWTYNNRSKKVSHWIITARK